MKQPEKHTCSTPLELSEIASYRLGELPAATEADIEAQYFACAGCAQRVRWAEEVESAVIDIVHRGGVRAAVTERFVRKARAAGIVIREYSIEPGGSVQCTIAPGDDFVVVRLGVGPLSAPTVQVTSSMTDLERGLAGSSVTQDAVVDRSSQAVLYAFPGDVVRGFPKSRWVMTVSATDEAGAQGLGPYTMNHTPFGA